MAEVRFEHVAKRFGEVSVIEDLNLDIQDHEFMVLVGPSGCGKSTALRMIAGLEEISDGTIAIGDRVVNDLPPKDRDIAMVFQNYALYPHMTVRENLEFGLKIRKTPAGRDRPARRRGGRDPRRSRTCSTASRSSSPAASASASPLGRAIVRKPAVFLFDEPLSNLDAKLRVQMRAEIKKLQQRLKTTTVYVTHDQVEAMTMGHRIAVMKDGKIQQVGTPLEIYDRPDEPLRRQLHRHAADELLRRDARGRRRDARRRRSSRCRCRASLRAAHRRRTTGEKVVVGHPAGAHPRSRPTPTRGETARARGGGRDRRAARRRGHRPRPRRRRRCSSSRSSPSHARGRAEASSSSSSSTALHLFDAETENAASTA